jgi:hypothetical protein
MNIDLSQLITAEDKAAGALVQAQYIAWAECRRRILAVVDETAQLNLSAAASAGLLTAEQLVAWKAILHWVGAMRAAWSAIAEDELDPKDDANWPAVPDVMPTVGGTF